MINTNYGKCREWWDAKAHKEERDGNDESVNRALRWRELERHLQGVRTILEVGAATGAFSIPLARRGFDVTHLDLSPAMLDVAREKANGIPNIQFVEGNAIDLSRYPDRSFDLVLNMDGAISFCGRDAEKAIRESCRVAAKKAILSVSNRAFMVAGWIYSSLMEMGKINSSDYEMLDKGLYHPDQFPENAPLTKDLTLSYLPPLKAFLPSELRSLLEDCGMRVLRCGAIGSLTGMLGPDVIRRAKENPEIFMEFIDFCDRYDREILPDGPGTRERAGLLAVAEPKAQGLPLAKEPRDG